MAAKTKTIVIEQEVLEPWKGQVDLVDAALLNHVVVRLIRRLHQKVVLHEGQPCVWVHYPTVRAENWLIGLTDKSLQTRFAKLARLGLLVRTQLSVKNNGSCRGSRAYYGIGPVLKARFEAVDLAEPVHKSNTDPPLERGHSYDPPLERGDYDPPLERGQSLGESLSRRVSAGAGLRSVRSRRPPSALPPKGKEEEDEEVGEGGARIWLNSKEGLQEMRRKIRAIPDLAERCRAKAHARERGFDV